MGTGKLRRWRAPAVLGASLLTLSAAVLIQRSMVGRLQRLPMQVAPPPPPPQCTERFYAESLREAAERFHVPEVPLEEMRAPLRGGVEFQGQRVLRPGSGRLQTKHLSVAAELQRLRYSLDGSQGFVADHLVLAITNRSSQPVVYRVQTSVANPERCESKADIPHNAIVLRPRETIRRTECLYRSGSVLVLRAEAYEISELSYRFLSRLDPGGLGVFDNRVARAHNGGDGTPCGASGQVPALPDVDPWRALVDYYARHHCADYMVPFTYRPFREPGALPVCAGAPPPG